MEAAARPDFRGASEGAWLLRPCLLTAAGGTEGYSDPGRPTDEVGSALLLSVETRFEGGRENTAIGQGSRQHERGMGGEVGDQRGNGLVGQEEDR